MNNRTLVYQHIIQVHVTKSQGAQIAYRVTTHETVCEKKQNGQKIKTKKFQ
jgi:hypothetical protein